MTVRSEALYIWTNRTLGGGGVRFLFFWCVMHGLAYAYTRAVSLMLAGQGENVADKERLPSCVRVCGCERVF